MPGGKTNLYKQSEGGKLNIFLYASVGIYRWRNWTRKKWKAPFQSTRTSMLYLFFFKVRYTCTWCCTLPTEGSRWVWFPPSLRELNNKKPPRGIHQIGVSQCESKTIEGRLWGCGPGHWRRWVWADIQGVATGITDSEYCWIIQIGY